ncbi:UNVERIFIED_ORG: hypothetical protein J2X80_001915 [Pseudomonas fluorescens]|nr:hypothetical protein [Pseudomonas fluorescens]
MGESLNTNRATDGDRQSLRCPGKIRLPQKKTAEKALIPLPPAGLAHLFYANPKVVQTDAPHRQTVGLSANRGTAQIANLRKEMKGIRTATLWPTWTFERLEVPSLQGRA